MAQAKKGAPRAKKTAKKAPTPKRAAAKKAVKKAVKEAVAKRVAAKKTVSKRVAAKKPLKQIRVKGPSNAAPSNRRKITVDGWDHEMGRTLMNLRRQAIAKHEDPPNYLIDENGRRLSYQAASYLMRFGNTGEVVRQSRPGVSAITQPTAAAKRGAAKRGAPAPKAPTAKRTAKRGGARPAAGGGDLLSYVVNTARGR